MLDLRTGDRKDVEIVRTIATRGTADGSGIAELATAIEVHRERAWTGDGAAERGDAACNRAARRARTCALADRASER